MNVTTLSGRAVRDIELKITPSGKPVASGTIAVQRKFKNAQGEYESDFIDFVSWGKGGELMANYIKKGDFFGLTGQLQTRTYQNNEGKKIKVIEVNVSDFDFPIKDKSKNENKRNTDDSHKPNNDPFGDMGIENSDEFPF